MSDRDISDVTGYTYTFLTNGMTPDDNWTGEFKPGEKIRLRFVNAAAMTIFDVRIPGLKMTVVAADGQNIEPVSVDEFRIGVAETYDVIVEPQEGAYTIFSQAIDRSGYARGTLAEQPGMAAEIPALDPAVILGHADMGMAHAGHDGMDHGSMDHDSMNHAAEPAMDHSQHGGMEQTADNHAGHTTLGKAGFGSAAPIVHPETENGFPDGYAGRNAARPVGRPGYWPARQRQARADLCGPEEP